MTFSLPLVPRMLLRRSIPNFCQVLLQLAKRIFEEQTSLDKVVHNIMSESQELLNCERCSVSLVDTSVENVSL